MPASARLTAGRRAAQVGAAAAMLLVCVSAAAAQPYAVHVFTPEDGASDEEARRDSVEDLRRALQDCEYASLFTLVDSKEGAELLLEVSWRGALETMTTVTTTRPVPGGAPLGSQQRVRQNNLRLTLHAPGVDYEFLAIDPGRTSRFGGLPYLSWRGLADCAAERAARWVRQNRSRLERDAR